MEETRAYQKCKVQELNTSLAIIIPKSMCQYLEIEKGDEIGIIDRHGKFGRYASIWNITRQGEQK